MTQTATELLPHPGEIRAPEPVREPDVDVNALLAQCSLAWRCTRAGLMIDGDRFDPKAFPYLLEIYDERHPNIVAQKAAQLGLTAAFILILIDEMRAHRYPRGAIYGFPTGDEAIKFSQARFARILRDNAAYFAGTVQDQDSAALKSIGGSMLYFLGIRMPAQTDERAVQLLSKPADGLYLDEYNDMDPNAIATVMTRLDSSEVRDVRRFGHPSFPGYGIAKLYEESDQRRWLIKCRACGHHTCLEDTFPSCLGRAGDGPWFRCCASCRREIYVIDGDWVATHAERTDQRGYLMSQLLSTRKPMNVIVEQYKTMCETGKNEAEFWNFVLAKPFADRSKALDLDFVLSLFNADYPEREAFHGPSFLGCDPGVRELHVEIGHRTDESHKQMHWQGEVKSFDELYDLGKRHHVECGVIDGMAESRAVNEFCKRASWAWAARYTETNEPQPLWHADSDGRVVKLARTPALDGTHHAMVSGLFKFPRLTKHGESVIAKQMINLARQKVHTPKSEKTGQDVYRWEVIGTKNDHHRHSLTYADAASTRVGIAHAPDPRGRSREPRPRHWMAA